MWLISPPPTTVKVCGVVRDDRRGRSSPWIQLFGHPLGFVPFFALYESVHSFFNEVQVEIQLSCLETQTHTHAHTHARTHTHSKVQEHIQSLVLMPQTTVTDVTVRSERDGCQI